MDQRSFTRKTWFPLQIETKKYEIYPHPSTRSVWLGGLELSLCVKTSSTTDKKQNHWGHEGIKVSKRIALAENPYMSTLPLPPREGVWQDIERGEDPDERAQTWDGRASSGTVVSHQGYSPSAIGVPGPKVPKETETAKHSLLSAIPSLLPQAPLSRPHLNLFSPLPQKTSASKDWWDKEDNFLI